MASGYASGRPTASLLRLGSRIPLGCFFPSYYRHSCYLPLRIFAGDHVLCAKLRSSNIDGAAGALESGLPIGVAE